MHAFARAGVHTLELRGQLQWLRGLPAKAAAFDRVASAPLSPPWRTCRQVDRLNLLTDAVPHLPFPHSFQVAGELRASDRRQLDRLAAQNTPTRVIGLKLGRREASARSQAGRQNSRSNRSISPPTTGDRNDRR